MTMCPASFFNNPIIEIETISMRTLEHVYGHSLWKYMGIIPQCVIDLAVSFSVLQNPTSHEQMNTSKPPIHAPTEPHAVVISLSWSPAPTWAASEAPE